MFAANEYDYQDDWIWVSGLLFWATVWGVWVLTGWQFLQVLWLLGG